MLLRFNFKLKHFKSESGTHNTLIETERGIKREREVNLICLGNKFNVVIIEIQYIFGAKNQGRIISEPRKLYWSNHWHTCNTE